MKGLVSWWLICSYLRQHHACEAVSPEVYADMARDLKQNFDKLEGPYAHLVTQARIEAGAPLDLKATDLPAATRTAASALVHLNWGLKIDHVHA